MKTSALFLALGAVAALSFRADAAISVTSTGAGPLDFATAPASPADFSSLTFAGDSDDFEAIAAFDASVMNTVATAVNTALGSSGTRPPSANALARHNTSGLYLQTRATGGAYTLMMATLVNAAGGDITSFTLTYDFAVENAAGATAAEAIPGQRVFFSTTGAAGSWQLIPSLSGLTVTTPGASATISGFSWPVGASAYILWADDNSLPNEDWGNTIDNLAISGVTTMTLPTTIAITSPTNGHSVAVCADLTVATAVTGSITNVDFLLDGFLVTNDTSFPFGGTVMVPAATPLGNHTLTAVATDTTGAMVTSVGVTFTVVANTAPQITITNTFSGTVTGTTFLVGSPITVQAGFSDDDAITNISWYVNDWLYLTNRINGQWIYLNALAGTTVLTGVAADRKGTLTSNSVTLTITNPPANQYTLLVTNGSTWRYYVNSTMEPPNVGVPWFDFFFDDSGADWADGLAEIGNGDIPNGYAERTLVDLGPANPRYSAFYFRKGFMVDDPSFYPNLSLRLIRDDGAVVYLNGVPVWTNNMTPTAFPVPYGDFAAGSDDGVNYQVLNLANPSGAPVVNAGFNIVAVEVHQQNATSSDVSFDLMIWGETNIAPVMNITAPTNGQSFIQGVNVTVNVNASTFVTNVIVKFDGNVVGEDVTPPYSLVISNVGPPGTHTIDAMGTDSFGAMAMAPQVTINVVPNAPPSVSLTNPPAGSNLLVGTFVLVGASAADTDGTVARVEFYDNGTLRLTDTTSPYQFTLNDLTAGAHTLSAVAVDNGGASNTSSVMITVTNPPALTAILTNGAEWKYLDDGTDQGTAWQLLAFNDTGWSNGIADLGYGDGPGVPERTVVGFGGVDTNKFITTYFRKKINVTDPAAFGSLRLDSLRDDGVVVYINGTEVFRNNFVNTTTPILFNEEADAAIGGVDESTYISTNISPAVLVTGTNIIAVEIHQDDGQSSDISFDLMIWGTAPAGPTLSIALEGSNVRITWTGGGTLQFADDMNDNPVWQDQLTGQQGPGNYLIPANQAHRFYSLRQ